MKITDFYAASGVTHPESMHAIWKNSPVNKAGPPLTKDGFQELLRNMAEDTPFEQESRG